MELMHDITSDLPITEGMTDARHLLIGLMALARYQHQIFWFASFKGKTDCLAPIPDDRDFMTTNPLKNVANYTFRVLAPGIVIRDDQSVCQLVCNSPHLRPFAPIPVPSATEHDP